MPIWSRIKFQDRNSPHMNRLIEFHEHCIAYIILIAIITGLITMFRASQSPFFKSSKEQESTEIFWSIIPAAILVIIAIPSIEKLYRSEEQTRRALTIRANGHQWYWSYEFTDAPEIDTEGFVEDSPHRLIITGKHLILPTKTNIQILSSSADVIHSWAVPSLGVKADAVPGRINQIVTSINRPRILVGQCSEICGANHRFIPITISALTPNKFSEGARGV